VISPNIPHNGWVPRGSDLLCLQEFQPRSVELPASDLRANSMLGDSHHRLHALDAHRTSSHLSSGGPLQSNSWRSFKEGSTDKHSPHTISAQPFDHPGVQPLGDEREERNVAQILSELVFSASSAPASTSPPAPDPSGSPLLATMIKQGHSDQKILPAQLRQPSHQFINPSSFPSFLIPRPPLGTLLAAHSPPLNPKASAPAISSSTYPPQPTFLFRRPTKTRRKTSLTEKTALLRLFKEGNIYPNKEQRKMIAQQLGMNPRQVQVWFQNQRSKLAKAGGMPKSHLLRRPSLSEEHDKRTSWRDSAFLPNLYSAHYRSPTSSSPPISPPENPSVPLARQPIIAPILSSAASALSGLQPDPRASLTSGRTICETSSPGESDHNQPPPLEESGGKVIIEDGGSDDEAENSAWHRSFIQPMAH